NDYDAVEFSPRADDAFRLIYGKGRGILINSDSHNLGTISEAVNFIELKKCGAEALIEYLRSRGIPEGGYKS
ncbi:MAG: hypothetical protein LBQ27_02940, partial [Clostridiales bacterium]|nr:hypothetical protein [Clostridiales bacterium]